MSEGTEFQGGDKMRRARDLNPGEFFGSSPGPPANTEHRPTFFMQRQAKNSTFHFKVLGFCGPFSGFQEKANIA